MMTVWLRKVSGFTTNARLVNKAQLSYATALSGTQALTTLVFKLEHSVAMKISRVPGPRM